MAQQDKFTYLNLYARGEHVRMMYSMAGKPINEEVIAIGDWSKRKPEFDLGQLPVIDTEFGRFNESMTIGRYVAKKLGFFGSNLREETINDFVSENVSSAWGMGKIFPYRVAKVIPVPENAAEIEKAELDKWIQLLKWLEKETVARGTKHLAGDTIMLADIALFCALKSIGMHIPEILTATKWTVDFLKTMEGDERIAKHLKERPQYGI